MKFSNISVTELLVIFTLGIASVLPTLFGPFIFDDGEAIVKNEDIISPEKVSISKLFTHDFWGVKLTHLQSHKSYRPLTTLIYRWEYGLWGANPLPFHSVSLIIHGLNCCLVYLFLRKCISSLSQARVAQEQLADDIIANGKASSIIGPESLCQYTQDHQVCFWAALVFAVHPIHVEPLGALVGQADLIASFIFLLSFILLPSDSNMRNALLMNVAAIVGSLFKENAVVIVVFIIAMQVLRIHQSSRNLKLRQLLSCHLLALCIMGCFITWRLWFQGGPPVFQPFDNPAAFAENYFTKVASVVYIWLLNAFLLFCPIWLCFDWSMGCISLIESPLDPRFLLTLVCVPVGLIILATTVRNRTVMISLLISSATFLPSSNLLFTVGFVIAERNLYLVSVGYCLLISHVIVTRKALSILGFILMLYFSRSMQRSFDWTSQEALFQAGVKVCPNNAKVHYNLGTTYGDAGNISLAISFYTKAIDLKPDYYQSMNNLGNVLRTKGNTGEAEVWLRKAVSIKHDFPAAWMNLGIVLSQKNKSEALYCYKKALEHRKYYPDCEYNLGNLYLEMGDTDAAYQSWKKAITLNSAYSQAWINIIVLLDQKGKLTDAKAWGINASKLLKDEHTLQFLVGNVLGKLGEYDEAKQRFENAINLCLSNAKPVPPKYWTNLGVLYHRWGKKHDAANCYQEALKLDPTSEATRKNLAMLKL